MSRFYNILFIILFFATHNALADGTNEEADPAQGRLTKVTENENIFDNMPREDPVQVPYMQGMSKEQEHGISKFQEHPVKGTQKQELIDKTLPSETYEINKFLNIFTHSFVGIEIISYLDLSNIGRLQQVSKTTHSSIDEILKTFPGVAKRLIGIDFSEHDKTLREYADAAYTQNSSRLGGSIRCARALLTNLHNGAISDIKLKKSLTYFVDLICQKTPSWISFHIKKIEEHSIEPLFEQQLRRQKVKKVDWKAVGEALENLDFGPTSFSPRFLPLLLNIVLKKGVLVTKGLFMSICTSGIEESYLMVKLILKYGYDLNQRWGDSVITSNTSLLYWLDCHYNALENYNHQRYLYPEIMLVNCFKIMQLLVQEGANISEITESPLYEPLLKIREKFLLAKT